MASEDESAPLPQCPSCGDRMQHLRTIWKAFGEDQEVFGCTGCGVSVVQAAERQR